MSSRPPHGFHYFLDDDVLRDYGKKPLPLRLEWLYMGNLLRQACPESTKKRHDRLRAAPPSEQESEEMP